MITKDEFKTFLRSSLRGDAFIEQDIYIEDDKLEIVAIAYEELVKQRMTEENDE